MNVRHVSLLAALVLALCGCQQEKIREIDWAKAALARNPDYQIIATDENAGVFTVRDTTTGEVSTLKLAELIAAPRQAHEAREASPAPAPASVPDEPVEAAQEGADLLAAHQTTDDAAPAPLTTGTPLATGPGYQISRAGGAPEAASEPLEGPGYRIERSNSGAPANQPRPAARAEAAASAERRSEPIICQGERLMRIDGETLEFAGDAVIAEKGCDLYISNARIHAGGVGIIARQARVHIANSTISGGRASYEASEGAQIYVARSTFTGIGRRFDNASMTDLGGNSYSTR